MQTQTIVEQKKREKSCRNENVDRVSCHGKRRIGEKTRRRVRGWPVRKFPSVWYDRQRERERQKEREREREREASHNSQFTCSICSAGIIYYKYTKKLQRRIEDRKSFAVR